MRYIDSEQKEIISHLHSEIVTLRAAIEELKKEPKNKRLRKEEPKNNRLRKEEL